MVNIPWFTEFYTSQVIVWDFWTINSTNVETVRFFWETHTKRIAEWFFQAPKPSEAFAPGQMSVDFFLLEKSNPRKTSVSLFLFNYILKTCVFFWNYFRSVLNIHYARFDLSNVLFLVLWLAWWFVMVDIIVFFCVLIWIHIWHWIFL